MVRSTTLGRERPKRDRTERLYFGAARAECCRPADMLPGNRQSMRTHERPGCRTERPRLGVARGEMAPLPISTLGVPTCRQGDPRVCGRLARYRALI